MWGLFALSVLAATLFLFLPGFFLLRSLRISSLASIASAPFVTIVIYGVMSIAYAEAGVFCSWAVLVLPTVGASLAWWVICSLVRRRSSSPGCQSRRIGSWGMQIRAFDWLCFGLYLVVGLGVSLLVLALSLDGADSFVQEYDNVFHLGVIRGFVDAGNWSCLNVSLYPSTAEAVFNPLAVAGYYPTAWHSVAALVVSFLGAPVALGANAANFTFAAIVFPSGMFLLMKRLFPTKPRAVLLGALCTVAFAPFPWGFLDFGPLYSNLSSFALLPAVLCCFISVFSRGIALRSRVVAGGLFFLGLVGLALAQPNAIFTMAVFLVPFCTYRIMKGIDVVVPASRRRAYVKIGCCALFFVVVGVIWVICFNASFLQPVVTHDWPAYTGKIQATVDAVTLAFNQPASQIGLAVIVALGIVYTFYEKEFLWLSCSFGLMLVIFIASAAFDSQVKFLLSGFWYTDPYRTAASAAFSAIPLAGIGLMVTASAMRTGLSWVAARRGASSPRNATSLCLAAMTFAVLVYCPNYEIPGAFEVKTAFGAVFDSLRLMNDSTRSDVYSPEERAFVQRVKRVVPVNSVILNEPNDGTAFAYGADGLDVYYRNLRTYGEDDESNDSRLIRTGLDTISSNAEVRSAVEHVEARYVLVLDQGDVLEEQPYLFTYDPEEWVGINAIDDDTPGFKVVLGEGDMRLYEIEPV